VKWKVQTQPSTPQWDSGDGLLTGTPTQGLLSRNLREYHSLLHQNVFPTDGKKHFSKPDIQFTALYQHQTYLIKEYLFYDLWVLVIPTIMRNMISVVILLVLWQYLFLSLPKTTQEDNMNEIMYL